MNISTGGGAGLPHSVKDSENGLDRLASRLSETLERQKVAVISASSIAYFALTFFLAQRKLYWFDELFTVYLCRLPDMQSVWRTLLTGVDANPPLFYLLTRTSQHFLGDSPIATRLPEILGFWIFCLCLFRFTSLRLPFLSACVSMLFPIVTGAYWYAFEARPHGIVLGFCGLALISWQAAADRTARRGWWLLALGGSLTCALLTHSYGFLIFIPIAFGELSRTLIRKKLDWPVWATIAAPSLAVLASVPFVHRVLAEMGFAASLLKLVVLYGNFLLPAAGVIFGSLILTFLLHTKADGVKNQPGLRGYEVVALWTFVAVPVFEYLAAKATGAPFFSRYGVSTVAGFAGLLGVVVARKPGVAMGTLLLLLWQIVLAFVSFASGSVLYEPSSGYAISTRMNQFNERYVAMDAAENGNLPIVLIDDLDFIPTAYYAPPSVASRFVYVRWGDDGVKEWYDRLRACCQTTTPALELEQFLATHDTFLVYGRLLANYRLSKLIDKGATVIQKKEMGDHFLALVTYHKGTVAGARP